jgi:hypothetical protein
MKSPKVIAEEQNLEFIVVRQEGAKSVQLVPRSVFPNDPFSPILKRPKNVMKMNNYPGSK